MLPQELPFLTLREQANLIAHREVSPPELVLAYLSRIDAVDGRLHAYITVCADEALRAARQAQQDIASGQYKGALLGIPISLKDQIRTKGIRTTGGCAVFKDMVPQEDATLVRRLKDSGAIILGKLNLSELACGGTRVHPFGTPRNPWNPDYTPGESSSGSGIAVAAHLCSAAIGEDTGGSVRYPASCCGVVGLRPTAGRVSRYGLMPLSWSMDAAGPMARTVEDCALVLQAIAGYDPQDGTSLRVPVPSYTQGLKDGAQGLRLGYVREFLRRENNHPEVQGAVERALATFRELGAAVEEVSIPLLQLTAPIFVAIADTDGAAVYRDLLQTRPQDIDDNTRTRLLAASFVPSSLYHKAQRARRLLRQHIIEALRRVDVLVSPTTPHPPFKIAESGTRFASKEDMAKRMFGTRSYMPAYSLAGLPALSVPCGFTTANLPIGLHIAGRPFEEGTILRAAFAYEAATEWHRRRPPV